MQYAIIMIIAGLLAAPKLITGKSREAEDLLKKIAPYQGWIGVALFAWGVYDLIGLFGSLDVLKAVGILWLVTIIAIVAMELILGILLGFNLINKYVLSKNAQAAEKGAMLHKKLQTKQTLFGLLGVVIGIWTLIADIVIY